MRFVPHTQADRTEMFARLGLNDWQDLFKDIPQSLMRQNLALPSPMWEGELAQHMENLSKRNHDTQQYISFLGGGAYRHHIPAVIPPLLQRSEFYTAYTPYQPEISQGTLQAIFEFQTMVCQLTGMDAANASMYDGATALAEAAIMAVDTTRRRRILVSAALHPEYRQVLDTYLEGLDVEVEEIPLFEGQLELEKLEQTLDNEVAAVIVQNPNFFGVVECGRDIAKVVKNSKALLIVAVSDPMSLGLLAAPGSYQADIVVGEGQAFGNPVNFGGPLLGFFAASARYARRMPGRIVGQTTDQQGRRGFVLTLQAREQHIRRDKASSNICTNQALCALAATIHLSYLGKEGLSKLANLLYQRAHYFQQKLSAVPGVEIAFAGPYFREFTLKVDNLDDALDALYDQGVIAGIPLERFFPAMKDHLLVCVDELTTPQDMEKALSLWEGLS